MANKHKVEVSTAGRPVYDQAVEHTGPNGCQHRAQHHQNLGVHRHCWCHRLRLLLTGERFIEPRQPARYISPSSAVVRPRSRRRSAPVSTMPA